MRAGPLPQAIIPQRRRAQGSPVNVAAATLARLSSLLDHALEVPPGERAEWIDALVGEDAELAGTLRRLLLAGRGPQTGDWAGGRLALGSALPPSMPGDEGPPAGFREGQRVGPYRLLQPLGRGGMGEVWQAERADGAFTRQVALKLPLHRARSGVLAERFARERDIVASLVHPHISRLYDAGVDAQGQPWLALELVQGQPIQRACDERGLDAAARIGLLLQLLSAVQHAHAALVIHRDIKPGNVLVDAQGRAMLLDFGIAKLLADEHASAEETELTREAGRAMSLAYAAPEQIEGRPLGTACDLWALGVLLYELLAGRRPFVQGHAYAMAQAILSDEPARLDRSAGALAALPASRAAELGHILAKALRKNPAERYASAAAFAEDLQRWLDQRPVQAQPESWRYRSGRFVARHRAAVLGATAALLALLVATGVSLQQAGVAREQSRLAQTEAATARAVQDFLEGIFRASSGDQADPVKARQRTAKELLDEGAARIEGALADAPAAKLRVLHTLAEMYVELGDAQASLRLLEARLPLASRLHGEGSREHQLAELGLADQLAQLGKLDEAQRRIDQVRLRLARHPDASGDVSLAIDMAAAVAHNYRGDGLGLEQAERALATLRQRPPGKDRVSAAFLVGSIHYNAGRYEPARNALREALEMTTALPAGAISMQGGLLANLADAELRLGEVDSALSHYEQGARLQRQNQGPAGRDTLMISGRWGQALLVEGRLQEAVDVFQPLVDAARAVAAESPMAEPVLQARVLLARAWQKRGDSQRAIQIAEDAMAWYRKGGDQASSVWPTAWIYYSQALADEGHFEAADMALAQAADLARRHGTERSVARSVVAERVRQLLWRGQVAQAREVWQARAAPGTTRARDRSAELAVEAEFRLAAGEPAAALQAARAGLDGLASAAWGRVPLRESLQLLQAEALLGMGRGAEAFSAADAALRSMQARLDAATSLELARAWALAGRSLAATGQFDAARQLHARARQALARHPKAGARARRPVDELGALLASRRATG
jgi:serine/threonine protein kinase